MSFAQHTAQVEGLYLTFLESGGQDAIALKHATKAAYGALDELPAALEAKLTPNQQRQLENLLYIYNQLTTNSQGWDPAQRRGWLEEARELLLLLQG